MGPPRSRAGTLAGGRRVGAGRGAGGARGVGRHGWRMASLLSTLPLPPPPVTAPPSARHPHSRVTVLGADSQDRLRLAPPSSRLRRASRPPAPRTPLSPGLRLSGLRARRALLGASGPRLRRAPAAPASPWIALSPLPPSRAPSPVTRPPQLSRVRSLPPVGRVRHKGSGALTPISRLCLPLLLAHSMTFAPHGERVGPPSPFPFSRNKWVGITVHPQKGLDIVFLVPQLIMKRWL